MLVISHRLSTLSRNLLRREILIQPNCISHFQKFRTQCALFQDNKSIHKTLTAEADEALQIEANLFENSTLVHKPTFKNNLLNERTQKQAAIKNIRKDGKSATKSSEYKIIDDPELGLKFIRTNRVNDPLITNLMTQIRSKRRRDKDRLIVLEGFRLIREALQCKMELKTVIFSKIDELEKLKGEIGEVQRKTQTNIYKVAQHDIKMWSNLTTPPGILAIFKRPTEQLNVQSKALALPITVICDNIREPNNLGSIIRSCAAIPCYQIIITNGCCDPWDTKALRGGCGGQFRLPIRDDVDWQDLHLFIPPETAHDCHVFIAENNVQKIQNKEEVISYCNVERTGAHNIVIIGGESHGVSEEAYKLMKTVGSNGKCLHIPLANGVESLNVASALTLILYSLREAFLNQVVK